MSLSSLVRRYLEAMVQARAPVLEEKSAEDLDRSQRASLARALQDSELIPGYSHGQDKTYQR